MANWFEVLQNVASIARHVQDLQAELRSLRTDTEVRLRALERADAQGAGENISGRVRAVEEAVARLAQVVARLEEARATTRAEVRAEITAAVAELRVRYAEAQVLRQAEPLSLPGEPE